jgi:hypothetical protein
MWSSSRPYAIRAFVPDTDLLLALPAFTVVFVFMCVRPFPSSRCFAATLRAAA